MNPSSSPLPNLTRIVTERALQSPEIELAVAALLNHEVSDAEKESFLTAWVQRGETAEELAGCAEALLPFATDPGIRGSWNGKPLLDCCGTGGGGLNLFNVSTGLMFILSAMGIPVVKHGNRGITKKSGSADVLEALGIKIDLHPKDAVRCLDEIGGVFLFAPAYHPTFAAIGPVRRKLAAEGQRTIFNLLGPLLNPARPEARLVGVFKPEHVVLYRDALVQMNCPRFLVVCGEDAASHRMLGEISASGNTVMSGTNTLTSGEKFDQLEMSASVEGATSLDHLLVQNAQESAARLISFLSGEEKGLGRELLIVNAAAASWTQGTCASFEEGIVRSTEALDSGRALEQLKRWQKFSETIP